MSDLTGANGLTVITVIVVLSFAIDRVTAALMFLLSFNAGWSRRYPEPSLIESTRDRFYAERRRKLIYFLFATILAFGVLIFADQVRVLSALGFKSTRSPFKTSPAASPLVSGSPSQTASPTPSVSPIIDVSTADEPSAPFAILDFVITALILIGGADRIEHLFRPPGAGGDGREEPKPLEIKGTITLDDKSGK